MSIEAMAWVLHHCHVKGTEKVVMLGIANHADNRGRNAWPSIATLATYATVTERAVQQSIQKLVEGGYLAVQDQRGGDEDTRSDRRPNRYVILGMQAVDNDSDGVKPSSPRTPNGVKSSAPRGEASFANGVKPTSPEPSFEPSIEPTDRQTEHNTEPEPTTEVGRSVEFDQTVIILTAHAEDTCTASIVNRKRWRDGTARIIRQEQADDIERLLDEGHTPQETAEQLTGDGLGVRNAMRKRSMEVHPPKGWEVAS